MMTPSEKADILIDKFTHMDAAPWVAVDHALICVNEILFLYNTGDLKDKFGKYFIEVRKELENRTK